MLKLFLARALIPVSIFRWVSIRFSQLYLDPDRISLRKKLIASVIACLLVLLLIPLVGGKFSFIDEEAKKYQGWFSDLVINICKDKQLGGNEDIDISILAVDDRLFAEWQKPYITPREKLQEMIAFAASHDAAVVVVDFDLTRSEAWKTKTEGDRALKSYLEQIDNAPAGTVPAVILLRTFSADGDALYDSFMRKGSSLADNQGNVFWATTAMPVDDDALVRRFNWYKSYQKEGEFRRIASVQLLSSFILAQLKKRPKNPAAAIAESQHWAESLSAALPNASLLQTFSGRHPGNEFSYQPSLMMLHDNGASEASGPRQSFSRLTPSGIRIDAYGEMRSKKLSPAHYQQGIVYIGSMHSRTMDRHETALGTRYGVELLAESTATINHFGELQPLTGFWLWLYNTVLLLAMVVILLLPSIFLIILVMGLVGTLIYLPASIFLFQVGLTLDAGPPILMIEMAEPAIPFFLSLVLNFPYFVENRHKIKQRLVEKIKKGWQSAEGEGV